METFQKKEKISEWVPKAEFNKLNEEYTALEKEFEQKDEKLRIFAEEITHLKKQLEQGEANLNKPIIEEKPQEEAPATV